MVKRKVKFTTMMIDKRKFLFYIFLKPLILEIIKNGVMMSKNLGYLWAEQDKMINTINKTIKTSLVFLFSIIYYTLVF